MLGHQQVTPRSQAWALGLPPPVLGPVMAKPLVKSPRVGSDEAV